MKKILSIAVISATMLGAAAQAQAYFGDDQLVQVFYTRDNNKIEIGVDLGGLGTDFNLTDVNKSLKTVDYASLAATKGATAGELRMGMYIDSMISTYDAVWDHYFVTTDTTAPVAQNASKYSSLNGVASSVKNYYTGTYNIEQIGSGDVVIGDPTYANSYRYKMNANNTSPGVYSNMNTAVTPGELILADMTGEYTDLYLWHFSYDNGLGTTSNPTRTSHLVAGTDTDYSAVLRFYANGETVLNPTSTSPTPVPGAVWMLGSGLAGLVGLRRKQEC